MIKKKTGGAFEFAVSKSLPCWVLGMWCLVSVPLFPADRYLELNLNNQTARNRLRSSRSQPLLDILRVIRQAERDKNIRGMVLNISGFSADRAVLWELRSALESFKAGGKRICAFISHADLDLYNLASVADKIVMDEQGSLTFLGYVYGRAYLQHTLEKLGVGVRELRYLEYKSAAETFTRDSLSEADRRQYEAYLEDIFSLTRETLMKARSWSPGEFDAILNNEYLYSAKAALDRGLVDRIGREKALIETLSELEEAGVRSFALYGDAAASLLGHKNPPYRLKRGGGLFRAAPKIAVVYAPGQTDLERGMRARTLARIIRETSEKRSVKAMVVRINSPGGSAEAADYVAEAIRYAKERIPVVVSMGPVAASGGYWAAMYASHITASPYTLTGSIGVIGTWFYNQGLNEKLGLTIDLIQRGDHADMMTGVILTRRDLSPQEEARYRTYILDLYGEFTAKVAAGRNMEPEQVEAAAQGRVYSGLGALHAGLIDSIGGLAGAIETARRLAEIPGKKEVIYDEYPRPRFFDKLINQLAAAVPRETGAAAFPKGIFFPGSALAEPEVLADLEYRISQNGRVMPILPLAAGGL
ncbi:MAG: S49 family peptidase [Treponema sp.]|nr:S49 family peptidase [Treponema sp.]